MYNILVINPNSSQKVTDNLENVLSKTEDESIQLHYYTAPKESPPEITNNITSKKSEEIVFKDLIDNKLIDKYNGFIIGCYSDHPLTKSLSKYSKKPCLGIMQATLLYSLSNPSVNKSIILTSTSEWEKLLDQGIIDFMGVDSFPTKKFVRTKGLNVSVNDLSNPQEYEKIYNVVKQLLEEYQSEGVNCVLLGCAGMAGLDEKLSKDFNNVVFFVDCCKIAVDLLSSLVRFDNR